MKAMVGTAYGKGELPRLPRGLGDAGAGPAPLAGKLPRNRLHRKHFVQWTPLAPTHIATPRPRFMIFLIIICSNLSAVVLETLFPF